MRLFIRICACILSLLIGLELTLSQRPPHPPLMPTEKAGFDYLRELRDTQLPLLTQLAERIRSPQEADAAVYTLAELLRNRTEAFCKLPMAPLSPAQATERFQHLLDAEAALMQSDTSTAFRREDGRLRAADFYHSVSLRTLWENYIIRLTPQGPRLPWMPGSEHAMKRLDLPPTNAEMTLLALDAFASVGMRGDFVPKGAFVAPATPNMRGLKGLFEDCFCHRYCFRADAAPAPKALSGAPAAWAASSPCALLALTPETARNLPALLAEHRTDNDTSFIYRLTPPFRSTYLVISIPQDRGQPASFVFTEDVSEFTSARFGHPGQREE